LKKLPGRHVQVELSDSQRQMLFEISELNDWEPYSRLMKRGLLLLAEQYGVNPKKVNLED
jgi:hypothetical protein